MAREGSNIIPFDDAWRRSSSRPRSSYRDSYRAEESSRRTRRQPFGHDDHEPARTPSREAFPLLDGEFPADPAWLDRIDGGVTSRPVRPDRGVSPVRTSAFRSSRQKEPSADPVRFSEVPRSRSSRPGDSLVAGFGERRSSRQREDQEDIAPRAAVEVYDESSLDEEDADGRVRSKADRKKKQKAKARAEKLFLRQFGSSDASDGTEGGSRAALYKGEMGRSHKRAFEDLGGSARGRKKADSKPGRAAKEHDSGLPKLTFVVAAFALLLFAAVFLYSPARQYYLEMRANDQLQAEYDALNERNQAIQEEIDYLSTDEGIQDEAREQLGWVQEGEVAVVVKGLEEEEEEDAVRAQVPSGSVPAPTTWYSPVLDMIFGFNDGTDADTSRQEAAATVDDAGVQEAQEAQEDQAAEGQEGSAKQE